MIFVSAVKRQISLYYPVSRRFHVSNEFFLQEAVVARYKRVSLSD
ncbi:hypothetical protein N665_2328s0007 [Sinapis alba]|nr:hypothetical protein N665_2328s0007 [Sinapis alba]